MADDAKIALNTIINFRQDLHDVTNVLFSDGSYDLLERAINLLPDDSQINLIVRSAKDDGGMPIQYYVVEQMDESGSGRWAHVGETNGPQLFYHVENLIKSHFYRFRIRAINKEGKSEPLETSGVHEAKNPFEVPTKPGRPKVVNLIHHGLTWNGRDLNGIEAVLSLDTSLRREIPTTRDGKFVPELTLKVQLVK